MQDEIDMTGNDFENLFRFCASNCVQPVRSRIVSRPRRKASTSPSRAWVWRIICVSLASQPVQAAISRVR
nr:Uncharacterised protein [Klebsiella pneumoniae]